MSDVPFSSIIIMLVQTALVVALPVYLLFFRNKRSSSRPTEKLVGQTGPPSELAHSGEMNQQPACGRLPGWMVVFGGALGYYRGRSLTLIPLGLASSIFTSIVFGALWFLASLRGGGESYASILAPLTATPLTLAASLVGAGTVLALMLWCQLAFLLAHVEEPLAQGDVLVKAMHRIVPYAFLCLLYLVVVTLGAILLIVPGILAAICYSLAGVVFASERVGPLNALRRSRTYLKGRLAEIVPSLFALVCFAAVALYSSILLAIPETTRNAPLPFLVPLMAFPLVLFGHFAATCHFVLYQELKTAGLPLLVPLAETFPGEADPAAEGLLRCAWGDYKRRAQTLGAIQSTYFAVVVLGGAGYLWIGQVLTDWLLPDLGAVDGIFLPPAVLGEYSVGLLVILVVMLFLGLLFLTILYVLTLHFGLALTFAIVDTRVGVVNALGKARGLLDRYVLTSLPRDFLILLGMIFYLPGLLFRAWYAFTPFVFVLEGARGKEALARSRAYATAHPKIIFKLLTAEFLKSLLRGPILEGVSVLSVLVVFAPLLVFSMLILVVFVGIFDLIGIPSALYVMIYSTTMGHLLLGLLLTVPMFFLLFFLPAFLLAYYYRIYQSVRHFQQHNVLPV